MMATTTPNPSPNPDAGHRGTRDSQGSVSFQTVLEQDVPPEEAGAETPDLPQIEVEQEPEAALLDAVVEEPENPAAQAKTEDVTADQQANGQPLLPGGPAIAPPDTAAPDPVAGSNLTSTDKVGGITPALTHGLAWKQSHRVGANSMITPQPVRSDAPMPSEKPSVPANMPTMAPAEPQTALPAQEKPRPQAMPQPEAPSSPVTTAPPAAADKPAPSVAQMQVMASVKPTKPEVSAAIQDVEPLMSTRDDPAPSLIRETSTAAQTTPANVRTEISRAIAGQMAAAIQSRPGAGGVEIALNPEELGRVSIVLNGRDDGMHMTIAVERPETLDMMRRHISVLTAEFEKLGYEGMTFDLGTSADSNSDSGADQSYSQTASSQQDQLPAPQPVRTGAGNGVDIRL